MGGNAFNASHPEATFPRMSPSVYHLAKTQIQAALQPLYEHVATPAEAPQKADHGDIDFLVCFPKSDVTTEHIHAALGAVWSIPKKGTSHFALPWDTIAGRHTDELSRPGDHIQVDVYIADDFAQFERVRFCHSYGDLTMILGLMARSCRLSLGSNGLRLANPVPTSPPFTFHLSSSFPEILIFFGLTMSRWSEGFTTQDEIFEWISSSPYYNPGVMARSESDHQGGRKAREARGMYQNFLIYARRRTNGKASVPDREAAMQTALQTFGRWDVYCRVLHVAAVKSHISASFTGKLVTEWTDAHGPPVRWLMDEVKKKLGGDQPDQDSLADFQESEQSEFIIDPMHRTLCAWQIGMGAMNILAIRTLVEQVKEEMDKDGRLEFDWKEAKLKREAERKAALAAGTTSSPISLDDASSGQALN
ncbi:hypothetical protein EUX98_g8982 [Antrodiella citrinella]|uniref:Uncharacterized protein n=1 Tax=Antrodiella citrinella TaxID=2447956 RepID=A0A4S4LZX9_9APHY|nr:hypothetical protein EUX98_g8982 [Antrodiella citrinella]